ncbi:MAG: terminase family protein, partial [Candidatus Micrarchaeia archaeon]
MSFHPKHWFKSQKYLIHHIANADNEQREFVILKSRQQGITTLLSAFDLFYALEIPGTKVAILMDDYKNAWKVRGDIIFQFYPNVTGKIKARLISSSREMARFDNGSTIQFLYTSNRAEIRGKTGRSQSYNYLHASEVAFFKSEEDLLSLQASLAHKHPYRLYFYESTANGLNIFYEMYQDAKKSPVKKAIFIGWWLHDYYMIDPEKEKKAYMAYSYPLTKEEKEWVRLVKKLYGYEVSMPQIAWWRMQMVERYRGDINFCLQEYPWTEDQAFQLSGNRFFPVNSIVTHIANVSIKKQSYEYFYVSFDNNQFRFEKLKGPKGANFYMFEPPSLSGVYVIGADPTMGANPDSDNGVISIWRCYKEKVVQVAEFVDNQVSPQMFARY